MKVQNGKIYIARGEEFTFNSKLYMGDGTPFRLLEQSDLTQINYIFFTIKRTPFKRDSSADADLVLRYELQLTGPAPSNSEYEALHMFDSMDVVELSQAPTVSSTGQLSPAAADKNKVSANCLYHYDKSWYYFEAPYLYLYVADILFAVPTEDTKQLTEDTYYWELDLVSTLIVDDIKSVKKIPLTNSAEFVVGGSIYD